MAHRARCAAPCGDRLPSTTAALAWLRPCGATREAAAELACPVPPGLAGDPTFARCPALELCAELVGTLFAEEGVHVLLNRRVLQASIDAAIVEEEDAIAAPVLDDAL